MSDNQIPTDEAFEESQDPSVEEESPSAHDQSQLPEEVKIGDETYRREEVEEVFKEFGGDWRKMQAAHTNRSKEVAAERREVERQKAEIERMKAELAGRSDGRQETSYDEDDPVQTLLREQREIKERLDRQEQRYQASMADLEQQDKLDKAMDGLRGKPGFNENDVREYLSVHGLGPEHASLVYQALSGFKLGEVYGEANAVSRYRSPVLGSTTPGGVSPGVSETFATPQRSIADVSWEEIEREAVNDSGLG